jgi:cytochrome P450
LLRTCEEEVELDGYRFPAGTMVLPQVSIALNNPAYFAEPKQFRPERFIDENANLRKYDAFLPFSIGKRFLVLPIAS